MILLYKYLLKLASSYLFVTDNSRWTYIYFDVFLFVGL